MAIKTSWENRRVASASGKRIRAEHFRPLAFGTGSGPVYQDVMAALYRSEQRIPMVSFIGGLAGSDITVEDHFARVVEITGRAAKGDIPQETIWLNEND